MMNTYMCSKYPVKFYICSLSIKRFHPYFELFYFHDEYGQWENTHPGKIGNNPKRDCKPTLKQQILPNSVGRPFGSICSTFLPLISLSNQLYRMDYVGHNGLLWPAKGPS